MKSYRLLMNCILVATVATLGSGTAFAQTTGSDDEVCDPYAADAADNPDCATPTQGPHCDYADTCGTAETCGTATTCDTATTCQYADTCGDAATCDNATTCDTATTAAHCDTATSADTCGQATTATYAETVGECTTGVFSVGGGASPNCGDLRYDGNLGINTDPTATLDVAGTVALRGAAGQTGLQVDAAGNVGVGTATPTERLDVAGVVVADAFAHTTTPTSVPRVRALNPATDCVGGSDVTLSTDGRASFSHLNCAIALEPGAIVTAVECKGWNTANVTIHQRDADFNQVAYWNATGDMGGTIGGPLDVSPPSDPPALAEGGTYLVYVEADNVNNQAGLWGCKFSYEVAPWW